MINLYKLQLFLYIAYEGALINENDIYKNYFHLSYYKKNNKIML